MPAATSVSEDWVEVPFRVLKEHGGMRLDTYLALRLHKYSRARVQRIIDDGRVSLRGHGVKAASRVAWEEDLVRYYPDMDEPSQLSRRLL